MSFEYVEWQSNASRSNLILPFIFQLFSIAVENVCCIVPPMPDSEIQLLYRDKSAHEDSIELIKLSLEWDFKHVLLTLEFRRRI